MQNVYLAGKYSTREQLAKFAAELEGVHVHITSRWLQESCKPTVQMDELKRSFLLATAIKDKEDIDQSDVVVLFSEESTTPTYRNGRMWEFGYAYGKGKKCVHVGPEENIFFVLPDIQQFKDVEELNTWLIERDYERGREEERYRKAGYAFDSGQAVNAVGGCVHPRGL